MKTLMHTLKTGLMMLCIVATANNFAYGQCCRPQAAYPFYDTTLDATGHGNDGILAGAILDTGYNGACDGAYNFDGVNDSILIDNNTLGNFGTNNFTVLFWMRTTYNGFQEYVMTKRSNCNWVPLWEIMVKNVGGTRVIGYAEATNTPSTVSRSLFGTTAVNDGVWHHIAVVREGGYLTIYVDGAVDAVSPTNNFTVNITNSQALRFGTSPCNGVASSNNYSGDLDEVEIFGCALSDSDIAERSEGPNFAAKRSNPQEDTGKEVRRMNIDLSGAKVVLLDQNLPNPFNEQTMVTYFVPEESESAQMVFTDLKGTVIRTIDLEKGDGIITVSADNLSNGTYSYSLIIDGKVMETKKMLKVK